MIISDLNHVDLVNEASQIEGGFYEYDGIYGSVYFGSFTAGIAYGHVAAAEANANAYGYGTFTKGATNTYTTPWSSSSGAFSVSVSS